MKFLVYVVFLVVSHALMAGAFRFSTYHRYWWWALPITTALGALLGVVFAYLGLDRFLIPHALLVAAILWMMGAHNKATAEMTLMAFSKTATEDQSARLETSLAATRLGIFYSGTAYLGGFIITCLYLMQPQPMP